MDLYRKFPFASYKIHQLWVHSILEEEEEQREAERKKEKEKELKNNFIEIHSPRSVLSIVAPSKRIDSQPIGQNKLPRLVLPSDAKKVKSPPKKQSDSKSSLTKQPIGQKKPPSLALPSDAKKVNSQIPKKKLKYTIGQLMRIDLYQRCPFSSYNYHQNWVKDLIEKEQRDKDKKKPSSSKCYESDLLEESDITEELSIGKRKRQDNDDFSEIESPRSVLQIQSPSKSIKEQLIRPKEPPSLVLASKAEKVESKKQVDTMIVEQWVPPSLGPESTTSSWQPRATFIPEAGIYALPYCVPF